MLKIPVNIPTARVRRIGKVLTHKLYMFVSMTTVSLPAQSLMYFYRRPLVMNIDIKVRTIDSLFSGEYAIYAKTYHALAFPDFVALHSHLFQPSAKPFGSFPLALHFSHPCR